MRRQRHRKRRWRATASPSRCGNIALALLMLRPSRQSVAALLVALPFLVSISACRRSPAVPEAAPLDAAFVAATNAAVGLMGRYDFDAAVEALSALSAAHPRSAETTLNLGIALINRQRPEDAPEAERVLRTVLNHPAVGVRAKYSLALLLLYQGRDADARPLLADVTAAAPSDPFPAYFSGQARLASAPAEALTWFDTAATLDPRLRSASYGAFQALQRLGRSGEATQRLTTFQALERDPRARLAEFKYTRMGPLAEATFVDAPQPPASRPPGAVFGPPTLLYARSGAASAQRLSITVADIDGDGMLDLFVAGGGTAPAVNVVLLHRGEGWTVDLAHPLARIADVRAALWADLDEDGQTDVVLIRGPGQTAYWRQTAPNQWRDVTGAFRAATAGVDAVDGAVFDADHDGDLDVWLTNTRGPNVLLNNNGNGTFRDIAREAGVAGDGRPSIGVAVTDLDNDRDHDLVVLKAVPPHEIYLNDRVWTYRRAPGVDAFVAEAAFAVTAADLDGDGRPELYTTGRAGLRQWARARDDRLLGRTLVEWQAIESAMTPGPAHLVAAADVDGDGRLELVVTAAESWRVYGVPERGDATALASGDGPLATWALAFIDHARGPSLVGVVGDGIREWAPGPGRFPFLALAPTGRSQTSDQRRSNGSGIGTKVSVRTGSRSTAFDTARVQTGAGQSLQPIAVGLGGAPRADVVSLTWSDGVLQTEVGLEAGRLHVIEETQRQLSSCPVLFAFDGTRMRFVSDILGVGGVGFFERPGAYSEPVPTESFLLPEGALAPTADGRHRLVVGEPMEEVAYFDRVALEAYDLPPGWQMALDERKAITGEPPTGRTIFYRDERLPVAAVNDRGHDVTARVTRADLSAAPVGTPDARFIGLTSRHSLELRFERPLDEGTGRPVLVIDGWVEYPYAQTMFAAWQAGAPFQAPTLEARGGDGRWRVVAPEFGYPAGMPRRMTLPLGRLPRGTRALRLSTTQEIYWDRVAVAYEEFLPSAAPLALTLSSARLSESGFARRTTGPQRTPFYDYDRRAPLWDAKHPRGWYTRFGEVTALLAEPDDATVILGPGEDVTLEFQAPQAPLPPGWTRRFVLRARGWCKDMDLYTKDGDTVEPLPGRTTPARARLHAEYNTRYESGF